MDYREFVDTAALANALRSARPPHMALWFQLGANYVLNAQRCGFWDECDEIATALREAATAALQEIARLGDADAHAVVNYACCLGLGDALAL